MTNLSFRKYYIIIILLFLISFQIYAQNGWTRKKDLPTPRVGASASVIGDKIYVLGGEGASNNEFAKNEVYDPSTNTWDKTKSDMPTPRGYLLTCVVNDTLYALGGGRGFGDKNEAYNPKTDSWTTKKNLPLPWYGVYGDTINSIIYIMGGNYNRQNCYAYETRTNTWKEEKSIPLGGCKGTLSATTYKGLIYTFGGVTNYPDWAMSTVNVYNPKTGKWEFRANMPTPRYSLRTFLVNGKIYAIGGSQGSGSALSTVEVYAPETDTWEQKPNMPFKVAWFTGAVYNNKIYIFGGTPDWVTGGTQVWEYDPGADTTTTGVEGELTIPKDFVLYQNYPNPFNPSTKISWHSPASSRQTLKIFDVLGKEVATLIDEEKPAGTYEVTWNAENLPSGVYFYQLKTVSYLETKKMILLR